MRTAVGSRHTTTVQPAVTVHQPSIRARDAAHDVVFKIARSAAHAMKSADGLVRLMEFASGRPDSRADLGTDWLRALTNEQLTRVSAWMDTNCEKPTAG